MNTIKVIPLGCKACRISDWLKCNKSTTRIWLADAWLFRMAARLHLSHSGCSRVCIQHRKGQKEDGTRELINYQSCCPISLCKAQGFNSSPRIAQYVYIDSPVVCKVLPQVSPQSSWWRRFHFLQVRDEKTAFPRGFANFPRSLKDKTDWCKMQAQGPDSGLFRAVSTLSLKQIFFKQMKTKNLICTWMVL